MRRIEKINSLLEKEIGRILLKKMDFGNALVTITNIRVNRNLSQAEVFITVMPETKEKEVIQILKRNTGNIQQIINKRLKMFSVPKINFKIDQSMKNFYKIDELSNKL